jgi:membrane-associated phospholipid phosphatase
MTLYGAAIVLNGGSYLTFTTGIALQHFIYSLLFLGTFMLPVLFSTLLWKSGKISSLEMPKREERYAPFLITLVCYAAVIAFAWKLPVPRLFIFLVGGGFMAILWSFVINLKWKISIHMTGIGGLMGIIYGIAHKFRMEPVLILTAISVVAGLLGTSRMILKAHTPAQVYVGFLSGFLLETLYCMAGSQ